MIGQSYTHKNIKLNTGDNTVKDEGTEIPKV